MVGGGTERERGKSKHKFQFSFVLFGSRIIPSLVPLHIYMYKYIYDIKTITLGVCTYKSYERTKKNKGALTEKHCEYHIRIALSTSTLQALCRS